MAPKRSVKTAIKCHSTNDWTEILPIVLLGLRSTFKPDINATTAEMIYGTTLRLPGEFFNTTNASTNRIQSDFASTLSQRMNLIRPTPAAHHTNDRCFVQKELKAATHAFVRNDKVKPPFQPPYDGPYKILNRQEKWMEIEIKNKPIKISIDRLKAAFIANDDTTTTNFLSLNPAVIPNAPLTNTAKNLSNAPQPNQTIDPSLGLPRTIDLRSGRKVHFK